MARCGRCALWCPYPKDHDEKKYAGVCLWFQHRLHENEVFEARECGEFFEAIPGWTPQEQLDYKIKRDDIGKAHREALLGKRLALFGIGLSLFGILWSLVEFWLEAPSN